MATIIWLLSALITVLDYLTLVAHHLGLLVVAMTKTVMAVWILEIIIKKDRT